MSTKDYIYQATVVRVVDGDTIHLTLDLGFHLSATYDFRLAFINAPEMSTLAGKASRGWLVQRLASAPVWLVRSYRADKYGRWLVEILDGDGPSVNQQMLDAQLAVPWP